MSRRDTIIVSVLINAALLVVLFITAVTTKNSSKININDKTVNSKLLEETSIDAKELFSSDYDKIVTKPVSEKVEQKEFIALKEEEKTVKKEEEKSIIYKLPKIEANAVAQKTEAPKMDCVEVLVKRGDTLEKIALANNSKVSEIIDLNNLPNSFLRIGQKLLVPKKEKQNVVVKSQEKIQHEYYQVKVGDNPYVIAIKHNIKLSDLLKMNNLDEKKARRLRPGDKLRIK